MTPGFFVARRLTAPGWGRSYPLTVLGSTRRTVTLEASAQTTAAGEWALFTERGHVRLAGEPSIERRKVTWRLADGAVAPAAGSKVSWTGIVAPSPAAAGLPSVDHLFTLPSGCAPAWFIGAEPGERHPVWAVHLHGLGSSRAGTLRGVAAAAAVGLPSVVPSYRNTIEGPRTGRGRTHLGQTEVRDIDAVLEQLSATGEERFVLFGWSMGAQMALTLAASDRWRERIDRLVLDSPVMDWRHTLAANVTAAGLPRWTGRSAEGWLTSPWRSRLVGLEEPIDLDAMNRTTAGAVAIAQPVLIHHGASDRFAPRSDSEAFVKAAPRAQLSDLDSGHTTTWNAKSQDWLRITKRFLARDSGDF